MIRENQTLFNRLSIILDGLLIFISIPLAYWLRFYVFHGILGVPLERYLLMGILLIPVHLFTYAVMGLYESFRKKRLYQELETLLAANLLDFLLLLTALFLTKRCELFTVDSFFFSGIASGLLGIKRIIMRKMLHYARREGFNQKFVVLVGQGESAHRYADEITHNLELGYHIMGYVSDRNGWKDVEYLGGMDQLSALLEVQKPDIVVAALDAEEYLGLPNVIQACERTGTKLSLIPFYSKYMPAHPQFDSLNGLPMIDLRRIPLDNLGNAFLKRVMDITGSLVLIILTFPIMLVAAIGVYLSSPGEIIFKQTRVGLNKKEFSMYKFRSMRKNEDEDTGWSREQDPRKTRFGAFIRKFSIDELPQLFNVLKGDMSLVGPRPETSHFVKQFQEDVPLYMVKHQVRPGITGWAQVHGLRGDTSIPKRIRYDIFYIENWTLFLDIKILLMTPFKLINKESLVCKAGSFQ